MCRGPHQPECRDSPHIRGGTHQGTSARRVDVEQKGMESQRQYILKTTLSASNWRKIFNRVPRLPSEQ